MGHLLKIKCVDSRVNVHILGATSVPFTLSTVQVPNLALTHAKRITVWKMKYGKRGKLREEIKEGRWKGRGKKGKGKR